MLQKSRGYPTYGMLVHITRSAKALSFLILPWSLVLGFLSYLLYLQHFSLSRRKQDCILCLSFVCFSAAKLTCVPSAHLERSYKHSLSWHRYTDVAVAARRNLQRMRIELLVGRMLIHVLFQMKLSLKFW